MGPKPPPTPGCPRGRPAGLASFRLPAGPPSELSKLGALGGGDGGLRRGDPEARARREAVGRPRRSSPRAAPAAAPPARPPAGPGAGRATALRALSPRAPAGAGEAAAARAA